MDGSIEGRAITADWTVREVATLPDLAPFGEHIMLCRPSTWKRVLDGPIVMGTSTECQKNRVVRAFNQMRTLIAGGHKFALTFWDDAECVEDPRRRQTKLFHFPGKPGRPFILLISGGGYQSVCNSMEGFPAAPELVDAGYNVFVLSYRVRQTGLMPQPIDDVARAIRFILDNADSLGVGRMYAVMGFSAGAHLAAEWGTDNHGYDNYRLPKPASLVLCYPPIDLRLIDDKRLIESLCGEEGRNISEFCIDMHVWKGFPQTYLWQCRDDKVVPLEHHLKMVAALEMAGVPYRSRLFNRGGHALMEPHEESTDRWMEDVVEWLNGVFAIVE